MIWCAICVSTLYTVCYCVFSFTLDPGRRGSRIHTLQFLRGEPVLLHSSGGFSSVVVVCFLLLTDLSFRQSLDFGLGLWSEL